MTYRVGVDVSFWQGELSQAELSEWRRAGAEWAIVGYQQPHTADKHVDAFSAAGIPVIGVYAFIYFGSSWGRTATLNAIAGAKRAGAERVWLDVEDTENPGLSPAERIAELRGLVLMVEAAGLEVGIYTGSWYWPYQMGNTDAFSRLPLWYSNYSPPGRPIEQVNFGGWSDVAIHQFTSGPFASRDALDQNYLIDEQDLREDMTADEVREIVRETMRVELVNAGLVGPGLPTFARFYEAMLARLEAAAEAFDPAEVPD